MVTTSGTVEEDRLNRALNYSDMSLNHIVVHSPCSTSWQEILKWIEMIVKTENTKYFISQVDNYRLIPNFRIKISFHE